MEDVFGANGVPPHAAIVVEELPIPFCILEVDAIAYVPENGEKITVADNTLNVPVRVSKRRGNCVKPIDPVAGSLIFCFCHGRPYIMGSSRQKYWQKVLALNNSENLPRTMQIGGFRVDTHQ